MRPVKGKCSKGLLLCDGGNFCVTNKDKCPITGIEVTSDRQEVKFPYRFGYRYLKIKRDGKQPLLNMKLGYESCFDKNMGYMPPEALVPLEA